MHVQAGKYQIDVRVIGALVCLAFVLAFTGGAAVIVVGKAHAAATPAERADCRRDRGVPVTAPDGSVVCINIASVVWEAARR